MKQSRCSPGDVIVLREIWDGKIWTARPVIVVEDDAELIALHIPPGTRWQYHFGCNGQTITAEERKNKSWILKEPDLKHWRLDDEDELQEAVDVDLISPEKARLLYAKGEEVRDLIMSGKSAFNGWKRWRPDPGWRIPTLPEGWDVI